MKIISVSYHYKKEETDPNKWLKKISFFTGILDELTKHAEVTHIFFINLNGEFVQRGIRHVFFRKASLLKFYKANRYLKNVDADIILIQGFRSSLQVLFLKAVLKIRSKIIVQHRAEKPTGFLKMAIQKITDKYVDAYFFSSLQQSDVWIQKKVIKTKSKVHDVFGASSVFYCIEKAKARSIAKVPANEKVFLWVGRLNSNKDPITLVAAFGDYCKINPSTKLYMIYQSEELLSEVKGAIKNCKNIVLLGKKSHDELLYWYNTADFIINTSYYEGGNIAIVEAMSCGCIPIVTNIPSFNKHTANHQVGFTFTAGKVEELYSALSATDNMNVNIERQKVLHYYAENLSPNAIAKQIYQVAVSLLS